MKKGKRKEDRERRTARLAPLDRQRYAKAEEGAPNEPEGVVRVTTGSFRIPAGISTEGKDAEPSGEWIAVLVVVAAACAFIGFITYLIATGSGK